MGQGGGPEDKGEPCLALTTDLNMVMSQMLENRIQHANGLERALVSEKDMGLEDRQRLGVLDIESVPIRD